MRPVCSISDKFWNFYLCNGCSIKRLLPLQRCGARRRSICATRTFLCCSRCKDKKFQNLSEIEQKSPVLTRTLSLARGFYPPSTPFYNTVRIPLNARHGSETSTPAARRFVRLWTPVSDATCVGTVRIPDTNARHSAAHVRLQAAPVSAYLRVCRAESLYETVS